MHLFEQKILTALPSKETTLIVALSGGADSVALLAALTALNIKCIAAHCNFHLRGDESNRDELHAYNICQQLNIPIEIKHFNIQEYCASVSRPTSLEMACRDLRYEWFEQLRIQKGAYAVAVAHNSDDNAETMLLNIVRGSGISGLRGMKHFNNRHIIRPMLNCSRVEVEQYLQYRGLPFITDSTNMQNDFYRNRLRNIVLPTLRQCFPNTDKGLQTTLSNLSENEAFYRQAIDEKRQVYTLSDGSISLIELSENEPHAELLLYEWFAPIGVSKTQITDILTHINDSGRRFPTPQGHLLIHRGKLSHIIDINTSFVFENIFRVEILPIELFKPERNPNIAYFDTTVLDGNKWLLRQWGEGDRLYPFGMHGSRKVSDIFTDAGLSTADKLQVPILEKDGKILWVVGIRTSRHYPVTESSTHFVKLHYIIATKKNES